MSVFDKQKATILKKNKETWKKGKKLLLKDKVKRI
jgi:hypothetical protein